MPAQKSYHTIAWHLALLGMLPTRGPGLTANELTQRLDDIHGYKVTKRSVERCLSDFIGIFGVTHANDDTPYLWKRLPSQTVDLPNMETPEALSLTLLGDVMRQLMPPAVAASFDSRLQKARDTLNDSGANRFLEWTKRARFVAQSLPSIPPSYPIERLKIIQEAIISKWQLQVDYLAPKAARASKLTLHPLGFVQKGNVSYLVASAFEYDEPRIFALHRMMSQKIIKEPARVIDGFSLDDYLAKGEFQFGSGAQIKLQATLTSELAYYIQECRLSEDQVIKQLADGRQRLTATVADSWQLAFWILSQGAEIVVEKPAHLRANIQAQLQEALKGYAVKPARS